MKLILVADLGLLRAYREVKRPQDREAHLKLIEELKPEAAHEKLSDQVTDQVGRFPRGSGADITTGDLSAGERLNLNAEQSRRLISLTETIDTLLADEAVTDCWLAASAPIHKQLLDALNPKARGKIGQVLASISPGPIRRSCPDTLRKPHRRTSMTVALLEPAGEKQAR